MEERNCFTELKVKLIEAGIDESKIKGLQNWLYDALLEQYQKGSDDAARIYNETLKQK